MTSGSSQPGPKQTKQKQKDWLIDTYIALHLHLVGSVGLPYYIIATTITTIYNILGW